MALGSYHDFIQSMLGLRNQRLQEERYKQLERMAQQEQMSKMMQGMGKQFGSMAEQMGQNRMANQLMEQQFGTTPPRAEGVTTPWSGQLAQGKAQAYQPHPGMFEGGMPELKMRAQMEGLTDDRMKALLAQRADKRAEEYLGVAKGNLAVAAKNAEDRDEGMDLRRQAAARAQEAADLRAEQKIVDDAMAANKLATPKYQEAVKNTNAFNKQIPAALKAIQHAVDAGDEQGYVDAIGLLDTHYQAATNQGLKVQMPKIASFQELLAAKSKQQAIDAANAGFWTWSKEAEQKEAERLTKELQGMPGYLQHPSRLDPENYLAPQPEAPPVPDIEALRAQARANRAAGASASAPATGLNVGQGAKAQASMSAAEYKAKTGEDVAPNTVKVDAKGRRLLITP